MNYEPLDVYCQTCSAGVGTPCSNPFTGEPVDFHRWRVQHAANASQGVFQIQWVP